MNGDSGRREMNRLTRIFAEAAEAANFTLLEMRGFQVKPKLALMSGMAIGYKLAIEDIEKKVVEVK